MKMSVIGFYKWIGTAALNDAKIKYEEVEQAVCGYVYGMRFLNFEKYISFFKSKILNHYYS